MSRTIHFARSILLCFLCLLTCRLTAQTTGLASKAAPAAAPSAGASGDSGSPVISSDGRYVLFASDAQDIVVSNNILSGKALGYFNVFMRDRVTRQTSLLSVNTLNNGPGNGDSTPIAISDDNRYVLFESFASNLVNGDTNNTSDIFLRDLTLGTTLLVSISTNGAAGNSWSRSATMTPDGRYVAFSSTANNLIAKDTNGISDIFVRDMQSNTTVCASIGSKTSGPGTTSIEPILSSDGRYVAFFSTATNLAPRATGQGGGFTVPGDVYLSDLTAGQTICVSTNARNMGVPSGSTTPCLNHVISTNGAVAAFSCGNYIFKFDVSNRVTTTISTAGFTNSALEAARSMTITPDGRFLVFIGGGGTTVYRWDAQSSNLVSKAIGAVCYEPDVDSSGQYVTFSVAGTNLSVSTCNLMRWDAQSGVTNLLNVDTFGNAIPISSMSVPSLSSNAQIIAFDCRDSQLVPNDINHAYDVIVRDLTAGTNDLISVHDPSLNSAPANLYASLTTLSISSNGQFIAFASAADNLVPNDTNPLGFSRVFFRDLTAGTNLLVSSYITGIALEPALSADGRYVAFTTRATNNFDVYVYDTQSNVTTLVSASTNGANHSLLTDASYAPAISQDGRYVLFQSAALDLTPGMTVRINHYLRDLQTGTTLALTTNSSKASVASMTPDGHYVALGFSPAVPALFVYDVSASKFVFTNFASSITNISISPGGNRIAYANGDGLSVIDRVTTTNRQVESYFRSKRPGLKFSTDGNYLAYATSPSISASNTDVRIFDFAASTNTLVSRSFLNGSSGGGTSDSPDLTSDGRYVAYRSDSATLVPGDTNGVPDLFLFDRVANSTRLISVDSSGYTYGNGRSLAPAFSADSKSLLFGSWAGNLVASDYNQGGDVFFTALKSDALITDSDNDGMEDSWETNYFHSLLRDGTGDFDGDGVSDLNEFLAGTDPTDAASYFHIQISATGNAGNSISLWWQARPNKSYLVEYKTNLFDAAWTQLSGGSAVFAGQGYAYDTNPSRTQRFYRVTLVP